VLQKGQSFPSENMGFLENMVFLSAVQWCELGVERIILRVFAAAGLCLRPKWNYWLVEAIQILGPQLLFASGKNFRS
jgi:hypothetical protein